MRLGLASGTRFSLAVQAVPVPWAVLAAGVQALAQHPTATMAAMPLLAAALRQVVQRLLAAGLAATVVVKLVLLLAVLAVVRQMARHLLVVLARLAR